MLKIQLVMNRESRIVCRDGKRHIEDSVGAVCVEFAGPDGRKVSLAFDGRYEESHIFGYNFRETYTIYRDCPVIDNRDRQSGPVGDLQAMRLLRDTLIDMDLGDYDPYSDCVECGKRFVRSDRIGSSYCAECAGKDYCAHCGEYADLNDEFLCECCA